MIFKFVQHWITHISFSKPSTFLLHVAAILRAINAFWRKKEVFVRLLLIPSWESSNFLDRCVCECACSSVCMCTAVEVYAFFLLLVFTLMELFPAQCLYASEFLKCRWSTRSRRSRRELTLQASPWDSSRVASVGLSPAHLGTFSDNL